MDQRTDEQLLDAIRQGDEAARMLHQRYAAHVIKVALHVTRNKAQAEEIAQDAWLALLLHLKRKGNITDFKPYLTATVVNRWRKVATKRPEAIASMDAGMLTQAELSEAESVSTEDDLPNKIENEILMKTLHSSLNSLEYQSVTLRYFDDLSYAEMAKILGKTESHPRQITHRALQVMRKQLG